MAQPDHLDPRAHPTWHALKDELAAICADDLDEAPAVTSIEGARRSRREDGRGLVQSRGRARRGGAAPRAPGAGQLVYVGDGAPTAGELTVDTVAARASHPLDERRVDLRLLGAGRSVDEVVLGGVARALGAAYERVGSGDGLDARIDAESRAACAARVIKNARLEVPASMRDVYPRVLPNLRLGEEIVVVGRLAKAEGGEVTLRGELGGKPYALARSIAFAGDLAAKNPLVPRLLGGGAHPRALRLFRQGDGGRGDAHSKRYHVMSRRTSLLVLEGDRMFAEFGIPRSAPGRQCRPARTGDRPTSGGE